MSRIYWHGLHHESELRGSERAYMGIMSNDFGSMVIRGWGTATMHPIERLLPPGVKLYDLRAGKEEAARLYLQSTFRDHKLIFGGKEHRVGDLVGNTLVATGSPYLALLAKLHGYCESHAWVAEEHREWLSKLIYEGRRLNIFRPDQGWESVAEHLGTNDGGPIVTSYSVCDQFPSMSACDWMDAGWPEEQRGAYQYDQLTAEQTQRVEERQEEWYALDQKVQWALAMDGLRKDWWLQITPDNLTTPLFSGSESLWDAIASPEWLSADQSS